jgi:hypothetical protein
MCSLPGSNWRPPDYETDALPTELKERGTLRCQLGAAPIIEILPLDGFGHHLLPFLVALDLWELVMGKVGKVGYPCQGWGTLAKGGSFKTLLKVNDNHGTVCSMAKIC